MLAVNHDTIKASSHLEAFGLYQTLHSSSPCQLALTVCRLASTKTVCVRAARTCSAKVSLVLV